MDQPRKNCMEELHRVYEMTMEFAQQIAELIAKENSNGPHMIAKTAGKIKHDADTYGYVGAAIGDQIVGFFGLMDAGQLDGQQLYERGSLIVREECRRQGIGNRLRQRLLEEHGHKPIYTVTNQPHVIKSNKEAGAILLDDVPENLKEIIEEQGALLPDDVVFVNEALFNLIK